MDPNSVDGLVQAIHNVDASLGCIATVLLLMLFFKNMGGK
jgi:hypothetical protein